MFIVLLILNLAFGGETLAPPYSYFFVKDYDEATQSFKDLSQAVKHNYATTQMLRTQIPSRKNEGLAIESLYIPPRKKTEGLIILVSGIHGVEGYLGSSVQRMILGEIFLKDKKDPIDTDETGYLFVHGVNAYGFKNERRVTENNVDLNRNFFSDAESFEKLKTKNEGYRRLNDYLNPTKKASAGWIEHVQFIARGLYELSRQSLGEITQAITEGQYEFPQGIFFGGTEFEPHYHLMKQLVSQMAKPYQKVLVLDLHSGYGRRGYMHLYPNPPKNKELVQRMKKIFGDYPIEKAGEGKEFFSNEGDFSTYLADMLEGQKKIAVPMLIEYGTEDSQTWAGSFKSLSRMVLENQAHWHLTKNESSKITIRKNFRESFFPSSIDWKMKVAQQTLTHFPVFFRNFTKNLN